MSDWAAHRAQAVAEDTARLCTLGWNTKADEQTAYLMDTYRYHALAGEFDHLAQFVPPDTVAVDVGANAGQYSLKLATLARRVISIEPVNAMDWLGESLPHNCAFFSMAASDRTGVARLRIPEIDGALACGLATLGNHQDDQPGYDQNTSTRTLDDILANTAPGERVGFVKIDVEGHERQVLRGARETLTRWRPNIQIEIYPEAFFAMREVIARLGYRGVFFFAHRLHDMSLYNPDIHCAAANAWAPDRDDFDPSQYVSDFFLLPTRRD